MQVKEKLISPVKKIIVKKRERTSNKISASQNDSKLFPRLPG